MGIGTRSGWIRWGSWAALLCALLAIALVAWPRSADNAILQQLMQVDTIIIQDDWSGMSPLAPIQQRYTLRRDGDRFKGQATFSLGAYSGEPQSATVEVIIPNETVGAFLKQLVNTPLEHGTYRPRQTHTDDYPERSIHLSGPEHTFDFYSASQGGGHWRLTIDQQEYLVNATTPDKALEQLAPQLRPDVWERLVNDLERARKAQR
jgi:hypothetical protein